jgi:transaldolase/glucose-6-phosphate isomerase
MVSSVEGMSGAGESPRRRFGAQEPAVREMLAALHKAQVARRIWGRDASLWTDSRAEVAAIEDRLGWLDLPTAMPIEVPRLQALRAELVAAGFRRAVLLGMGGSSLSAEVYREALGVAEGCLDLSVLDTTDPAEILRIDEGLNLAETVFIVASKSGTTAETMAQYQYFRERCEVALGASAWARHFIAITDAGNSLAALAQESGFRALYLNPADVGGRFSALSFFGLVPAALLGVDIDRLLERAAQMADACHLTADKGEHPAMLLGAAMGALASATAPRRDKLTLLTSARLASFGPWVEQLIAESTGKDGKGIVPVVGEHLGPRDPLGSDRFWVYLRLAGDDCTATDAFLERLVGADQPVMVFTLTDPYDLAAEFFRWEFATAVAGHCLSLNPFNQPDVDSAKRQARQALDRYERTRSLPEEAPVLRDGSLSIGGPALDASTLPAYLAAFLRLTQPGDYAALHAYVERSPEHAALLGDIAAIIRGKLGIPVTVGFGPRFLHSTGQLHKGGANKVLVVQITQAEARDLPIPGASYSFGILKRAQALGDMASLREAGRRAVRVQIGTDVREGLDALQRALTEAVTLLRF